MRTLVAETFHERIGATGLFSRDEVEWHVLPELVRVQTILEAFFELSFIQRVSPQKCSLSEALSAARWDPAALEIVRGALSEYRSTGLLSRLSTLTQRKDDVAFPAVWAALTPAGCAKITQNLCVELNATLKPMDIATTSVLTNLRQQAASLEQTNEVWTDVRRYAEQFGCHTGVFGLDAVEQFATQVLAGAEAELGKVTADALEEVKTLLENPEEPKTTLASRDPATRLVLYRREVAALTRGVALPALVQLETKEAASDEVEQWKRLVFDLASPEAVRAGGAPASAGRSGLFAFERFYADVLSRGVHACMVPFDSWRTGVFAVGERGFYERGRAFAAEVERVCALGKRKGSAG